MQRSFSLLFLSILWTSILLFLSVYLLISVFLSLLLKSSSQKVKLKFTYISLLLGDVLDRLFFYHLEKNHLNVCAHINFRPLFCYCGVFFYVMMMFPPDHLLSYVVTGGTKFASCFICKEQGHLSKNCPQNAHGIYPKVHCFVYCKWLQ